MMLPYAICNSVTVANQTIGCTTAAVINWIAATDWTVAANWTAD